MKRLLIDAYQVFETLYNGFVEKRDQDVKNVIVLFTGNEDPQTGKSWCPHCVYAKPVIENAIEGLQNTEQITFATVKVGHRDEWRKPDNPYRIHKVKINCVPTLISLKNVSITFSSCERKGDNDNLILIYLCTYRKTGSPTQWVRVLGQRESN